MRQFLLNPTIPNKCAGGVIIDYRTSKETIKTLNNIGIEVILSCRISSLYDAVCGHPDMMIHHAGKKRFIVAPEAYNHFRIAIPDADITMGSKSLNSKYPKDICYNAAAFGNYLICNTAHTAQEILTEYKYTEKKILNVKQGYSKCSICIIADNAIITSDSGIYKTAVNNGIDALKITEGHISLPGMSYGFIGGASGMLAKNLLAVNGDIKTHPDYNMINNFCKKYDVDIISLKKGEITDIGSIIPIF